MNYFALHFFAFFKRVSSSASNSSLLFNRGVILALTSTIWLPETLFLLPSAKNSLSLATGLPVGLKYLGHSPNQVLIVYAKRSAECSLLLEDKRISVAMVIQNSQLLELMIGDNELVIGSTHLGQTDMGEVQVVECG